jgi:hypothetical protein
LTFQPGALFLPIGGILELEHELCDISELKYLICTCHQFFHGAHGFVNGFQGCFHAVHRLSMIFLDLLMSLIDFSIVLTDFSMFIIDFLYFSWISPRLLLISRWFSPIIFHGFHSLLNGFH